MAYRKKCFSQDQIKYEHYDQLIMYEWTEILQDRYLVNMACRIGILSQGFLLHVGKGLEGSGRGGGGAGWSREK